MAAIVGYILEEGAVLKDGQTIGFRENQMYKITLIPAIAMEGESLKLSIVNKNKAILIKWVLGE